MHTRTEEPVPDHRAGLWRAGILYAVLALAVVAHLFQVFSPMRLDIDAIGYLSRTATIVDGERFGPSWHPPGYSYTLAALELVGFGHAWVFAGLNFAFFVLGLGASFYVLHRGLELSRQTALVVCTMTALSFVFFKYLPIPLAEGMYFGLSMTALALLYYRRAHPDRALLCLLASAGIALAAIATRSMGIALVAAFAAVIWAHVRASRPTGESRRRNPSAWIVPIVLGIVVSVVGVLFVLSSHYVSELIELYEKAGFERNFSNIIRARIRNWGELSLNAPTTVAPGPLRWLYRPMGIGFFALVAYGVVRRRKSFGPAEAYFAAVVLILLIYPGRQTRYWLPVVPLMFGWAAVALRGLPWRRIWSPILALYLIAYAVVGVGAIVYSSSITLAGDDVARVYGSGALRGAYEAAYDGRPHDEAEFDSGTRWRTYLLLRRYDPRARGSGD